jgi:hypothetical protein
MRGRVDPCKDALQTLRADVFDTGVASADRCHFPWIHVHCDDFVSSLSKRDRQRQPNVPQPNNSHRMQIAPSVLRQIRARGPRPHERAAIGTQRDGSRDFDLTYQRFYRPESGVGSDLVEGRVPVVIRLGQPPNPFA